jgi:MerR family mercuric resistance operon transcriptional regulator
MRIGEIAKKTGVGVETIRYYESRSLIEQPLKPGDGGYRDYPPETARRIRFVRDAQQLGFSLGEIVELLELQAGPGAGCVDVRRRAEAKLAEMLVKIENMQRIKLALEALIDACPGKGPVRECSILDGIKSGDLRLSPLKDGE